jgi:hypothetical protein
LALHLLILRDQEVQAAMMNPGALETVRITLGFSPPSHIGPVLERMTRASRGAAEIVRGRVTPENATYEIRLKGSPRGIARALRGCRSDGLMPRTTDSTDGRAI